MADDLKLRVKILEQLLSILSRNGAEDIMYDIDEYAKIHNDKAYEQGRADGKKEVLNELWKKICADKRTSIGMFGYNTCISLADLERIFKEFKEQ